MKKLFLGLGAVLVVALVAGASYYVLHLKEVPDDTFSLYVQKGAELKSLGQTQKMSGTGSQIDAVGLFDTNAKKIEISGDLKCSGKLNGDNFSLESTLVMKGESIYVRLNKVTGTVTSDEGVTLDLAKVYSKVRGQWYLLTKENPNIKSQLDSGVYIFNSVVMAPSYDSKKISDELINSGAFSYTTYKKDGDNYIYEFVAKKTQYLNSLKKLFPNLTSPDLILDDVFEDKDTVSSTVTVDKEGNLIKEDLSDSNLCTDMATTFVSEDFENITLSVSGTAVVKDAGDIKIQAVSGAKPIENMPDSFVY